ncbi:MAG: hypothetical protein CMK92_04800 [Pseudomonas sp.]|nr:hypothetical protein [Pseudomonas sp.]
MTTTAATELTFKGFQKAMRENTIGAWFSEAGTTTDRKQVAGIVHALICAYGVSEVHDGNFNSIMFKVDLERELVIRNMYSIGVFRYLRATFPDEFNKALSQQPSDYDLEEHLSEIDRFNEEMFMINHMLTCLLTFLQGRCGPLLEDSVYEENLKLCKLGKSWIQNNAKVIDALNKKDSLKLKQTEWFQRFGMVRAASVAALKN